ncbi:AfsR/SARP family transcriptional regulator [Pseudonocardia sp. TRM90224]|uniref:AfsR/SARP family transcriptional regulator n=1 Tax=Pseudonocardia sp. TRM90224 TaxID=2812678 RepID=UPI001E398730|nr:BTAD domain-containing putative transcriptional regulator [Pseudonocardia sp. TRM90224]
MTVRFGLLGPVVAHRDGREIDLGSPRQRCVLAVLLVDAGRVVPLDQLVDRVWGEHQPLRAVGTLHTYLSRLRVALAGDDCRITRRHGGYALDVAPDAVDVSRFRDLVAAARGQADERAAALLGEALALWRGEPFTSLDSPWLAGARDVLAAELCAAHLDHNDARLRLGHHTELLPELSRLAELHPLEERLAAQLMLAQYRSGQQAGALATFTRLRGRLADELGIDPGAALQELHQQVLAAAPALDRGSSEPFTTGGSGGSGGSGAVPRQLPAPPPFFVGRTRELAELGRVADQRETGSISIAAITGTGGMGKTWLAIRWAHDNLHRFPDGQLYVNLRGFDPAGRPVAPESAVRGFLVALGVEPAAIPVDVDAQTALYRSLLAGRRMLLVLDNAAETAQVTPLLPGSASCTVLVTSRHRLTGLIMASGAQPLVLDVLGTGEARDLLTTRLGAQRVEAHQESVAALLRQCSGLPLALGIIAARAAANPDLALSALADELRSAAVGMAAGMDAARDALDVFDAGEATADLRAVFSWSYDRLGADEARMFRSLGSHPGTDVSPAAAASLAGVPLDVARALLRNLAAVHLLTQYGPQRFGFHDLVRAYATHRSSVSDTATERTAAVHRVLDHYLQTSFRAALLFFPQRTRIELPPSVAGVIPTRLGDLQDALAWFDAEHAAIVVVAARAAEHGFDVHAWQLAWTLADYLDRTGRWDEQVVVQRTALDSAQRLGDLRGQVNAHRGMARASARTLAYDQAYAHLAATLDLLKQLGDLAGQSHTHLNFTESMLRDGRAAEALDHAEQALELGERAGNRMEQATARSAIGWCHAVLGDYEPALVECGRAVEMHGELGSRLNEADTWDSIGYVRQHLGDHGEAVSCYERALVVYREFDDRTKQGETLTHLGDAHHAAGNTAEARCAWEAALAMLERFDTRQAEGLRTRLRAGSGPGR